MNLFSYRLLLNLALPLVAYSGWKRCRKHQAQQHQPQWQAIENCFKSRFGFNPQAYQQNGIWVHAVSVGETRSIFPLLEKLHHNHPHLPLTLTSGSTQGALQALKFSPVPIQHQMLPYDYPFAVKRFLKKLKPKLVIMVETEIWPNLYQACHELHIPVVLINARLKQKSFKAYQKWGGKLIENALNQTEFIGAQTQTDAQNLMALGADSNKIRTLGNLKFDLNIDADLDTKAQIWRERNQALSRPIWVAASTHASPESSDAKASEEQLMLEAHTQLLKQQPDALLILVPRHANRFDEVGKIISNSGLSWQRRSSDELLKPATQVYLADSVGEMMLWYSVANIAFIGGSMVPFGGHNILEPAALHKPVLSGPHYQNLKAMFSPFIEADAIQIVENSTLLAETLNELLNDQSKAQALANKGHQCFTEQTGALERTLDALKPYLD